MDMDKFFCWRREYTIVLLSKASRRPLTLGEEKPKDMPHDSCKDVYEKLAARGDAVQRGPWFTLNVDQPRVREAEREGQRLMNELLQENIRLVRKYVGRYHRKSTQYTEESDLLQAGCIGFVKTLERFDPARFSEKGLGRSFTNYCEHWVRHEVQKSMREQLAIQHPRAFAMPYKVYKKAEEIRTIYGREPTAEELGIKQKELDDWRQVPIVYSEGHVSMGLRDSVGDHVDIEQEAGGAGGSFSLHGAHVSQSGAYASPEDEAVEIETRRRMEEALDLLSPKERKIIELTIEGKKQKEIAAIMKCSGEYVRVVTREAIDTIRGELEDVIYDVQNGGE